MALAPWLDGLTWLDRLRQAATRMAAPAALGVASLGILGGALVAPWSSIGPAAAAPRPAVVSLPTHEVAAARADIPAAPAAAATAPPAAAPQAAPEPPAAARPQTVLGRSGVTAPCVDAAGATAGGAACDEQSAPVLHIGPPLPANPTGIRRVGVEADRIDCRAIPTTPLTECTTEGDHR